MVRIAEQTQFTSPLEIPELNAPLPNEAVVGRAAIRAGETVGAAGRNLQPIARRREEMELERFTLLAQEMYLEDAPLFADAMNQSKALTGSEAVDLHKDFNERSRKIIESRQFENPLLRDLYMRQARPRIVRGIEILATFESAEHEKRKQAVLAFKVEEAKTFAVDNFESVAAYEDAKVAIAEVYVVYDRSGDFLPPGDGEDLVAAKIFLEISSMAVGIVQRAAKANPRRGQKLLEELKDDMSQEDFLKVAEIVDTQVNIQNVSLAVGAAILHTQQPAQIQQTLGPVSSGGSSRPNPDHKTVDQARKDLGRLFPDPAVRALAFRRFDDAVAEENKRGVQALRQDGAARTAEIDELINDGEIEAAGEVAQATLDPEVRAELVNHVENAATGFRKFQSDPGVESLLSSLAADDYESFTQVNLPTFRSRLTKERYEKFLSEQSAGRADLPKGFHPTISRLTTDYNLTREQSIDFNRVVNRELQQATFNKGSRLTVFEMDDLVGRIAASNVSNWLRFGLPKLEGIEDKDFADPQFFLFTEFGGFRKKMLEDYAASDRKAPGISTIRRKYTAWVQGGRDPDDFSGAQLQPDPVQ